MPRMAAKTYGGAESSKVWVLSYPRVLTIVGKKFVKAALVFRDNCMNHRMYSDGSVNASLRPSRELDL